MTLQQLKENILNNSVSNDFLIFQCEQNNFIANEYINAICKNNELTKKIITNLADTQNSSLALIFDTEAYLNVLYTEVFNEASSDYNRFTNTIVVCNKIDKKILNEVLSYIVVFPKLLDWQIKDYISVNCPALKQAEIDWLYSAANNDIYRIDAELDKLKLFDTAEQQNILLQLKDETISDLYNCTIFELSDAIVKNNKTFLLDYFSHKALLDFDPIALVTLLLTNYKKILYINFNSGLTIEQLGLTQKQANAIKYYYNFYTEKQIRNIIGFLSKIDLRLKSNELIMPKQLFIDYIICTINYFLM